MENIPQESISPLLISSSGMNAYVSCECSVDMNTILAKRTSAMNMDDYTTTGEGAYMDVRFHRSSKAAALTLVIILITALVSTWLNNPKPPVSWERQSVVSYSDGFFDIYVPPSFNITYDAEVNDLQNTTRIYVEISSELTLTHGLLSFEMVSGYHTPHSKYSITDYREATLTSSTSRVNWNTTAHEPLSPYWLHFHGLNETNEQDQIFPTEYTLQMIWNSSLTLVEERDNDTMFIANLSIWIHFGESQYQIDPALVSLLLIGEGSIGIVAIVGFYRFDKPVVID